MIETMKAAAEEQENDWEYNETERCLCWAGDDKGEQLACTQPATCGPCGNPRDEYYWHQEENRCALCNDGTSFDCYRDGHGGYAISDVADRNDCFVEAGLAAVKDEQCFECLVTRRCSRILQEGPTPPDPACNATCRDEREACFRRCADCECRCTMRDGNATVNASLVGVVITDCVPGCGEQLFNQTDDTGGDECNVGCQIVPPGPPKRVDLEGWRERPYPNITLFVGDSIAFRFTNYPDRCAAGAQHMRQCSGPSMSDRETGRPFSGPAVCSYDFGERMHLPPPDGDGACRAPAPGCGGTCEEGFYLEKNSVHEFIGPEHYAACNFSGATRWTEPALDCPDGFPTLVGDTCYTIPLAVGVHAQAHADNSRATKYQFVSDCASVPEECVTGRCSEGNTQQPCGTDADCPHVRARPPNTCEPRAPDSTDKTGFVARPINVTCFQPIGTDKYHHCGPLVGECLARGGTLATPAELQLWHEVGLWAQQGRVVAPSVIGVAAGVSQDKEITGKNRHQVWNGATGELEWEFLEDCCNAAPKHVWITTAGKSTRTTVYGESHYMLCVAPAIGSNKQNEPFNLTEHERHEVLWQEYAFDTWEGEKTYISLSGEPRSTWTSGWFGPFPSDPKHSDGPSQLIFLQTIGILADPPVADKVSVGLEAYYAAQNNGGILPEEELRCPPGRPCKIVCAGSTSCARMKVIAAEGQPLNIFCLCLIGHVCAKMQIDARAASSLHLYCSVIGSGAFDGACRDLTAMCPSGNGACSVDCVSNEDSSWAPSTCAGLQVDASLSTGYTPVVDPPGLPEMNCAGCTSAPQKCCHGATLTCPRDLYEKPLRLDAGRSQRCVVPPSQQATGIEAICDSPPCCAAAAAAQMFHRPEPPCGFIKRFDHAGRYYLGNKFDDPQHGDWCSVHGMRFVVTAVDPCTTFSFFKNAESMASYCAPGNWAPGGDGFRSGLGCEYLPTAERNADTCLAGTVTDAQVYDTVLTEEMLKVVLPGVGVNATLVNIFVADAADAAAKEQPDGAQQSKGGTELAAPKYLALAPLTFGTLLCVLLWFNGYYRPNHRPSSGPQGPEGPSAEPAALKRRSTMKRRPQGSEVFTHIFG